MSPPALPNPSFRGLTLRTSHTWDGKNAAEAEIATITFGIDATGLRIELEAPFHADQPPAAPPGRTDRLWEFEVVELFLLFADNHYLELEFGPHGHHLVLRLAGIRQVAQSGLPLAYAAEILGERWRGTAHLAAEHLAGPITRVNGYAIHGPGNARRYLAACPVPGPQPDFHQPRYFKAVAELAKSETSTSTIDAPEVRPALVIGGGPAGLMAAAVLAAAGVAVDLFDAMPRAGSKFLIAGKGGLNLTKNEELTDFAGRYGVQADFFKRLLARFSPDDLRAFLAGLGVPTFVGSSGRVFPVQDLRTAEILNRWLSHLACRGVRFFYGHRLVAIDSNGAFRFTYEGQSRTVRAKTAILALGGASWPQTGSDGAWPELLKKHGIDSVPFEPANCGVEVAWSPYFRQHFAGHPLKNLAIVGPDGAKATGEAVITRYGLEGGAIYPLIKELRDYLRAGSALLRLDLKRDLSEEQIFARLKEPRGRKSWSEHLRRTLRLDRAVYSLVRESCPPEIGDDPAGFAQALKNLPIAVRGLRPLAEAISSAGGLDFNEVDDRLMLRRLPGVFAAGEMLDWEAPTGGYLLQGAFSTGWLAGHGALRRLGNTCRP